MTDLHALTIVRPMPERLSSLDGSFLRVETANAHMRAQTPQRAHFPYTGPVALHRDPVTDCGTSAARGGRDTV
jgi:hypothetical protein